MLVAAMRDVSRNPESVQAVRTLIESSKALILVRKMAFYISFTSFYAAKLFRMADLHM